MDMSALTAAHLSNRHSHRFDPRREEAYYAAATAEIAAGKTVETAVGRVFTRLGAILLLFERVFRRNRQRSAKAG